LIYLIYFIYFMYSIYLTVDMQISQISGRVRFPGLRIRRSLNV